MQQDEYDGRYGTVAHNHRLVITLLERVSRNEQTIETLKEELIRRSDTDRELLEKIEQLHEGLLTAVNEYTLHRTYQKAIKNALYTTVMLIIFFLAFDLKEIGKTINDFLTAQR